MTDVQVGFGCVMAWALWGVAVVLVGLGLFWPGLLALGHLGIVALGGAVTLTVRGFFVKQSRIVHEAFDFGRESIEHQRVHPMR